MATKNSTTFEQKSVWMTEFCKIRFGSSSSIQLPNRHPYPGGALIAVLVKIFFFGEIGPLSSSWLAEEARPTPAPPPTGTHPGCSSISRRVTMQQSPVVAPLEAAPRGVGRSCDRSWRTRSRGHGATHRVLAACHRVRRRASCGS